MRNVMAIVIMCLVVGLLVVAFSGNLCSQQDGQTKIGVVDLENISTRFNKWTRYNEEFEKEKEKSNKKLEEMFNEIRKKEEIKSQFKEGSKQFQEIELEIIGLQKKAQYYAREQEKILKGKLDEMGAELFNDIEKVVADYGRQHGFALILRKEKKAPEGLDWVKLQMYYSTNPVMYYSANIDLTDVVVKILNEKFK